mgnify:FL=1|jgi:hypothetical protein
MNWVSMIEEIKKLQKELEQFACDWADDPGPGQYEIIKKAQCIRSRIQQLRERLNPPPSLNRDEWNCDSWGRLVKSFPGKKPKWR